jgi:hypothetical protein
MAAGREFEAARVAAGQSFRGGGPADGVADAVTQPAMRPVRLVAAQSLDDGERGQLQVRVEGHETEYLKAAAAEPHGAEAD